MDPAVFLGFGVLVGGMLAFLFGWGLRLLSMRRLRRSLASALVGEIVGILRVIETDAVVRHLHDAVEKGPKRVGKIGYRAFLPQPTIYEANANQLSIFRAPLPRKIAYFYTLLAGFAGKAHESIAELSRGTKHVMDVKDARTALSQLDEALPVADEILRALQPML